MNSIHDPVTACDNRAYSGTVIFANAKVILVDEILGAGSVTVTDGQIVTVAEGDHIPDAPGAEVIDCAGDYLMPGMVELHTDNIEKHILPRPGAMWPALAAAIAHDAQVISAGITTVYDSVAVGAFDEADVRLKALTAICDALEEGERDGVFKASHRIHLRCEVAFPGLEDLLDPLIGRPLTSLISIMDHTPGQRQFVDESKYVEYYKFKKGFTDAEMAAYVQARRVDQRLHGARNRTYAVGLAREHGHALASHDDATVEHVAEAVRDSMTIAEFPTTIASAKASHESGLAVLMGAIAAARSARTYDTVMLRVLGASRKQILLLQLAEYGLIAGVLALVALGLGSALAWVVITQLFEFDWLPDWGQVLSVLGLGVGLVLAFALGGSLPLLRAKPARALREL